MQRPYAFPFATLALAFSTLLAGCNEPAVDLSAIQSMVQTTDAGAPSYALLAADFYGSCKRAREWELTGQWRIPFTHRGAKPVVPLLPPLPHSPVASSNGDPCALASQSARQWQTMNLVVINYIDALGALAGGNEPADNSYGFDKLATSLTDSNLLSSGQATAIQGAFAKVVTDIFNHRRREAIAQNAPAAKAALDTIIDRLESVADSDYRGLLTIERLDINEFYTRNIQATQPGLENLETLSYRAKWRDDLHDLDTKTAAIEDYKGSLEALRSAHDSLVNSASHPQDLKSVVKAYITEYLPDLTAIDKAFSSKG